MLRYIIPRNKRIGGPEERGTAHVISYHVIYYTVQRFGGPECEEKSTYNIINI